ncbi:MAG: hypothetical protein ABIJ92_04295 [Candidatus Aenigmatarchaeota archaeon]
MSGLTAAEKEILEIMSKRLLVTTRELNKFLSSDKYNGGTDFSLQRLVDQGYLERVESLGTTVVVTQKGLRALKA